MTHVKAISVALAFVVVASVLGVYFSQTHGHDQAITVYFGSDTKDNVTFITRGRCAVVTQNGNLFSVVFVEQNGAHREIYGASRVFVDDVR